MYANRLRFYNNIYIEREGERLFDWFMNIYIFIWLHNNTDMLSVCLYLVFVSINELMWG